MLRLHGEREDDVKMLPEQLMVGGGVGGRELGASKTPIPIPMAADAFVSAMQSLPLARIEPALRLVAPDADPAPIRLTAAVTIPVATAEEPLDGCWSGDALRRLREARRLSLANLAERTKVARYHLENIEADDYVKLPAYVYLRGILLTVAKELRVDGQRVCRSYLDLAQKANDASTR